VGGFVVQTMLIITTTLHVQGGPKNRSPL